MRRAARLRWITVFGLFFFFLVEVIEVFIVVEFVFFVLLDVDVLDLVVKLFVDVLFVLVVEFLVVEFSRPRLVEVFVFEVVLVFSFFGLPGPSSSPGCRPNNGGGESDQPSRIALAAVGSAIVASQFQSSPAWIQSSGQGSSSGNSP